MNNLKISQNKSYQLVLKAFIEQAWLSDDEPNVDNEAVSDLD